MAKAMAELQARLGEITDLRCASAMLNWDKNTMMPRLGADRRREQIATLERITHERLISDSTLELIEAAEAERAALPEYDTEQEDAIERRIVSEARRIVEKNRCVPVELATARAEAAARGYNLWVAARDADDFGAFLPALEQNFKLAREYVACF